ncbi:hypothetical protein PCE1_000289 [Barthelona sp. PCE]
MLTSYIPRTLSEDHSLLLEMLKEFFNERKALGLPLFTSPLMAHGLMSALPDAMRMCFLQMFLLAEDGVLRFSNLNRFLSQTDMKLTIRQLTLMNVITKVDKTFVIEQSFFENYGSYRASMLPVSANNCIESTSDDIQHLQSCMDMLRLACCLLLVETDDRVDQFGAFIDSKEDDVPECIFAMFENAGIRSDSEQLLTFSLMLLPEQLLFLVDPLFAHNSTYFEMFIELAVMPPMSPVPQRVSDESEFLAILEVCGAVLNGRTTQLFEILLKSDAEKLHEIHNHPKLVVEPDLNMYVYTDTVLDCLLCSIFVDYTPDTIYPGFAVASFQDKRTLGCCSNLKKGFGSGITVHQIEKFVTTHLHPKARSKEIPTTLLEQLRFWHRDFYGFQTYNVVLGEKLPRGDKKLSRLLERTAPVITANITRGDQTTFWVAVHDNGSEPRDQLQQAIRFKV